MDTTTLLTGVKACLQAYRSANSDDERLEYAIALRKFAEELRLAVKAARRNQVEGVA